MVSTVEEEAEREIRKSSADWEFIRSQSPKKRIALELFVEQGASIKHLDSPG
ncbi:MAG: hypothetical protein ACUVXA_08570 [Candidatus Jordarchaeum sp.]|uniref:hypothetical protein n=1 Tax=Candidatus Jordarchaeum sp. TaxID=2823881 RepID=UPI00404AAC74